MSHFQYCQLVWMFHNHAMNNQINHLHERYLYLIYSDKQSFFRAILEKDDFVIKPRGSKWYKVYEDYLQRLSTNVLK